MEHDEQYKNIQAYKWVIIFKRPIGYNTSIRVKCDEHPIGYDDIEQYAHKYMKQHPDRFRGTSILTIYPLEAG